MLLDEKLVALSRYRLSQAQEELASASQNLTVSQLKTANNRAYYAIFHSMRAILALDSKDFSKHSGVISYFREHYIKNGIFDSNYSRIITDASLIRNKSDYEDFYIVSKEETTKQVENAKVFVLAVELYLLKRIDSY